MDLPYNYHNNQILLQEQIFTISQDFFLFFSELYTSIIC